MLEPVILKNILFSILAVVIAYIVHRIIMRSINKFISTLGKEVKAPKTLSLILAFLIYGFAIAGILAIWDVNLAPYLAGLGISGIVIGLALQEPLTNFMSGILVLVTRKVFEGEVVDIDGLTGIVDIVKMNHVHLKTFDGKMILIPNRKVWSGTVTKFWPGRYRRIDVDVTVDYSSDLDKVVSILKKVLEEEPLVVKDNSVENNVVFKSFDSNGVVYTVRFWTEKETYFDTLNAVAHRIKSEIDKNGIKIPFSIVEVKLVK
ncbi:MAG: mechanosensitive ion channel family protein [Fervidobacterium sp.]|uniref:Small conductance mechanosensitive channel n=1 Tax=Fervidobacterium gondwanense DSM 13020 TaxID=1121883 RepID=A0A1M7SVR8_FERGO|nr:mechanosensitive ion channel family protein [Fervidobacterium gondwanense]UXF00523.1 mechanosensitive ion channel protein [Fervidobacterium riparium]SHN62476.1 small conductance mechanosensitive channel [Fervidobacterium gondwanense DSM 13020]